MVQCSRYKIAFFLCEQQDTKAWIRDLAPATKASTSSKGRAVMASRRVVATEADELTWSSLLHLRLLQRSICDTEANEGSVKQVFARLVNIFRVDGGGSNHISL